MPDDRIHCPKCGKTYRWQTKIAGRRVRCACGQAMRLPMTAGGQVQVEDFVPPSSPAQPTHQPSVGPPAAKTPPPPPTTAPEPDTYDLDLPGEPAAQAAGDLAAQPSHAGKCPSCNLKLRPQAVICLNCGFNTIEGAKIQTLLNQDATADTPPADPDAPAHSEEDGRVQRALQRTKLEDELAGEMARRHHFQENIVPLILIGAGGLLLMLNSFILAPKLDAAWGYSDSAITETLIGSLVLLAVQVPCLFVGIVAISKLFGSAFGTLTSALKKLLALALAAGQFDLTLDLIFGIAMGPGAFFAVFLKLSLSFAVFWAVAKRLFDELEPNETIGLWVALALVPDWILFLLLLILSN